MANSVPGPRIETAATCRLTGATLSHAHTHTRHTKTITWWRLFLHPQTPDASPPHCPIAPFHSKRRSRNPNLLLRFLFELFWAAFAQSLAANFLNENGPHRERATLRVTHIGNQFALSLSRTLNPSHRKPKPKPKAPEENAFNVHPTRHEWRLKDAWLLVIVVSVSSCCFCLSLLLSLFWWWWWCTYYVSQCSVGARYLGLCLASILAQRERCHVRLGWGWYTLRGRGGEMVRGHWWLSSSRFQFDIDFCLTTT